MLLFVVAYLGGAFTILSPCILPVLPFVFARSDQPFIKSGLPLLVGMALTFAAVATLAAVGGGWAVQANQYGRLAAIVLLGFFGLTLLFPQLADRLTRPLVNLGSRLSMSAANQGKGGSSIGPSFPLGIATGLLWAPCAGPILGLLLTGAALQGASAQTTLLLLAYALGAATSLALALLIGGRVFAAMKKSLGAGEWIRRGLGVLVLAGVVVIALGLDTGFLAKVSTASTTSIEQALINKVQPMPPSVQPTIVAADGKIDLPVEGQFPALTGAVQWLNSPSLTPEQLKGKVVLVDFWTYSCINCLRTLPYVRAWADKYKNNGLVVIGVHTPEFAFEKDVGNVTKAAQDLMVNYPIAIDNDYGVWRAFNNQFWPAHFFIDAKGQIRHHQFGEGDYDQSERIIQQLLVEAGHSNVPTDIVKVDASGAMAQADDADRQSPETYVGYGRGKNLASPGGAVKDKAATYTAAVSPALNQWSLVGNWTEHGQYGALNEPGGAIRYRFHARDLHVVLGPSDDNKPVRFKVTVNGQPPGGSHGADTDEGGNGTITGQRLYQLVRQSGTVGDADFEITFLDAGAQAYSFTFG